jgi:hypothetical protein
MTEFAFYDPAWGNKIHDGLTIVKAEGSTVGEVATSLASMENVYEPAHTNLFISMTIVLNGKRLILPIF